MDKPEMEMRQGKCPDCRVRFRWPAYGLGLKVAYCPWCGHRLQRTTHLLQWATFEETPATYGEAVLIRRDAGRADP